MKEESASISLHLGRIRFHLSKESCVIFVVLIDQSFLGSAVRSQPRVRVSSHQLVSRQICLIGSKVNGVHGERTLG